MRRIITKFVFVGSGEACAKTLHWIAGLRSSAPRSKVLQVACVYGDFSTRLEPYAMDLWQHELPVFMPDDIEAEQCKIEVYFGGLYQKVVLSL